MGSPVVSSTYINEPELLLDIGTVTSASISFREAVERIERLLARTGAYTGLIVLEKRGEASFPLAGRGGRVRRPSQETILSRPVRAETRNLQVLLFSANPDGRGSGILADFLAEQIGALLTRDSLLGNREVLQAGIEGEHAQLLRVRRWLGPRAADEQVRPERESRKRMPDCFFTFLWFSGKKTNG